ncbi:MbtH family protein [Streptomyces sp. CMB-StM0423]|uniref:MbtH family protein n=1 Tax=Streptomyces sp. CMB-StM0423 TaxID=2059884 RepID=UPI000C7155DE|nr:MbtH family NRPS accessory protein [Streptomyces sp. CMB-StM0423]AUH38870.1 MbtH family protein [Streptomyces sp. CMB-StM0423]
MTDTVNAFDVPDERYHVLVNSEGQYSLWPALTDVPAGWEPVHGPAGRAQCLEYVESNWTDMRPRTLTVALDEG